jgi:hypothetical protein
MRMPFLAVVFAVVVAGFAAQYGTATKSVALPTATLNVLELQMKADKNLPVTITGDLV